jgi:hypothetical protein
MTRIIIRAVRERQDYINYLKEHLPDAEWCIDHDRHPMSNFLKALRMAGDGPAIHMEEDTLLAKDFRIRAESVIRYRPFDVVQFFSMRTADRDIGSRYDGTFTGCLCFYLPLFLSAEIVDYHYNYPLRLDPDGSVHRSGYDLMVRSYLRKKRRRYWIEVPNLVDHRIGKSAIDSRRSSKRLSMTFTDTP